MTGVFALLALLATHAPAAFDFAHAGVSENVHAAGVAVRGTEDSAVAASGRNLERSVNEASAGFHASIAPHDRLPAFGRPATVQDLLRAAQNVLARSAHPDPALSAVVASAQSLVGQGRVVFDCGLKDTDMGVYSFDAARPHDGVVKLNCKLGSMGTVTPIEFLVSVLVHEVGHHDDKDLGKEETLDGEVPAFSIQARWLEQVDPRGKRVAQFRQDLADGMYAAFPNDVTASAASFAASLDVLIGREERASTALGLRDELRRYAAELGYSNEPGGEGPERLAALAEQAQPAQ